MAELRLFAVGEAAAIVGGVLSPSFAAGAAAGAEVRSVSVDSRRVRAGSLFVALRGERSDGHDFIGAAIEAGAACVFAEAARRESLEAAYAEAAGKKACALVFVESPIAALQELALAHRRRFPGLLRVGITGSSGKTTTKECAAAILGRGRRLVSNQGNLNSDIGLPLSVFEIGSQHEVGVFEMGMNRKGEMAELARVYEPDIALITNVGTAHIGIIGSKEEIAQEKKTIFSRFDGRQTGLVWEDDEHSSYLKSGVRGRVLDFGPKSTHGFRGAWDRGLDGWDVDWEGLPFRFPLAGRHNLLNAIAAMAIAECVGTPPEDLAAGLASVRPLFGRSEVFKGEYTVLRDCYNANPESVEAAIGLCDGLDWRGRRAYVLGSMLELGGQSAAAHERMGAAAGGSKASALFFFGEEARPAFDAARARGFKGLVAHETDFDRLAAMVRAWLRPGDLVLLKASRVMALERLAELLGAGAGEGTHVP